MTRPYHFVYEYCYLTNWAICIKPFRRPSDAHFAYKCQVLLNSSFMGQSKITLESSTLDALLFNIKWELDTKPRQAFTFLSENTHFRRKNNVEVAETGNIETTTHIFCHLIPSQWRLVGTRGVLQHFVVNIWELTTTKRDHNFTGFSKSSSQNILHSK